MNHLGKILLLCSLLAAPVPAATLPSIDSEAVSDTEILVRLHDGHPYVEMAVYVDDSTTPSKTIGITGRRSHLLQGLAANGQYTIIFRTTSGGPQVRSIAARTFSSEESENLPSHYKSLIMNDNRIDLSHCMVSAVKSLAGQGAREDWFSIQMKLGGNRIDRAPTFSIFYVDLNISPENGGDDDAPTTEFINDLSLSYNVLTDRRDKDRDTFFGPTLKIYGGKAYYGAHIGGIERARSDFLGSYLASGAIAEMRTGKTKMFVEFTLRSDRGPSFLRTFAAHGSFLFSAKGDPVTRISLLIPIGGVHVFP